MAERSAPNGPCRCALALARVPARRWVTRADVLGCLEAAKHELELRALNGSSVSLRAAALSAGLSPFHFQRLFKRVYGRTPHAYVSQKRIERARSLIEWEGYSVLQACVEVGYSSPASFSRLFKRVFGVSPGELRRRPAIPPDAARR